MKAIVLLKNGTVHIIELNYAMNDINIPIMSEFINNSSNDIDYDVYMLTAETSKGLLIYEFSKSVKHKKQKYCDITNGGVL